MSALHGPPARLSDGLRSPRQRRGAAADRARLEHLCRYLLRPAVAQGRLRLLGDARIVLTLKTVWADGTRHLVFEWLTLLEKLAALTLRPRINLVLHHGVLAPNAAWRARVVSYGARTGEAPVAVSATRAILAALATSRERPDRAPPSAPVPDISHAAATGA